MNLLITGGAGFIGSALIRWLLSDEATEQRLLREGHMTKWTVKEIP